MGNNQSRLVHTAGVRPRIKNLPCSIGVLLKLYAALSQRSGGAPVTVMRLFGRAVLLGATGHLLSGYAGLAESKLARQCSRITFLTVPFQCAPLLAFAYSILPAGKLVGDLRRSFHQRATWTHIFTQVLKALGNMERRSQVMDKAFLSGFYLHRPWLYLFASYLIVIPMAYVVPGIDTDLNEQYGRAAMAILSLHLDQPIGNIKKSTISAYARSFDTRVFRLLRCMGLKNTFWPAPPSWVLPTAIGLIALNWRYPILKHHVQALILIRRADYKSWKDPELWASLGIRYTLFTLVYMLYRVQKRFNVAREQRRREETLVAPGSPVYASQYASYGAAKHQVLIVGDVKHELTVSRDGSAKAEYKQMEFKIDHQERTKARDQSVLALKDHYVYLIGWTKQNSQLVSALCRNKIATWMYNVTSHNCQHFIREVAEEIISKSLQAQDWGYFRLKVYTAYQRWLMAGWKFRLPFVIMWFLSGAYRWLFSGLAEASKAEKIGSFIGYNYANMFILKVLYSRYI
jgi:hypothetical protein